MQAIRRLSPPIDDSDRDRVCLNWDGYRAVIEPSNGALISALSRDLNGRQVDILHSPAARPFSPDGIAYFGCWPMLPFCNRCFDGRLVAGTDIIQLPINDPGAGNAMHGLGWECEWSIVEGTRSSVKLAHGSDRDFGPYVYDAALYIRLDADGMTMRVSVTNQGDTMPFGIGFHPWFDWSPDVILAFDAATIVTFAEGYHPTGQRALTLQDSFDDGRTIGAQETAINFDGWKGRASLTYPGSHRIHIGASRTLDTPLLWKPAGGTFVCFEPQSHAIGVPGEAKPSGVRPLAMLKTGETLSGWMTLSLDGDVF